jgi:allantoate deiminase
MRASPALSSQPTVADLQLAQTVMERVQALGQISEETGRLTRTFGSSAMRRANELVGTWMREAGMAVREDAIGNLIGSYAPRRRSKGTTQDSKLLLIGSHLDTVRDAGRFDGALGVLLALACVEQLRRRRTRLPFGIEVVGFSDEEGVRFHSPYLGSKAIAGKLVPELNRTDANGVTLAEAIRDFGGDPDALAGTRLDPGRLLGYLEVHIEQGPVLEQKKLALGVVKAIAGQTRLKLTFTGHAGHAGATPMNLRRDALCAAAEFLLDAELLGRSREELVATVGEITALPGASNVIPGEVRLSLDLRHPLDSVRQEATDELQNRAAAIATGRKVHLDWQLVHQTAAVKCDDRLSALLGEALKRHQKEAILLQSGAGHDAAMLAAVAPVVMLFVRCKGGLSHHPDESASLEDVRMAISVVNDFLQLLARNESI